MSENVTNINNIFNIKVSILSQIKKHLIKSTIGFHNNNIYLSTYILKKLYLVANTFILLHEFKYYLVVRGNFWNCTCDHLVDKKKY